MTQPSNKEMKLTRPVQVAALQLISSVGRTIERVMRHDPTPPSMAGGPRIVRNGNPWLELPARPPYVPPGDASAVEGFNARARPDYRLQLDLLPEPFLGSPDAPVVLLNLNPGFAEGDRAAHADVGFRNAVLRTLRHEPQPFPFHYLDPTGTSLGHRWWRQRLGRVLARVPAEHAASRLLCIEYFPYHSRKFAHGTLRLPSQAYGFELARQAVVRAASVVLLRGERPWLEAVPELASHAKLFRLRSRQNVTLSPRNCPGGFERVIEALAVHVQSGAVQQ